MLRFGTDGVRGDADAVLTSVSIRALGRALARAIRPSAFLIGRDTRLSGPRISSALAAGLADEGVAAVDLGVLPTPALASAAAARALPALVVSASHNPWTDNGVKVIGADGYKPPDATEAAIENHLVDALAEPIPGAASEPVGPGPGATVGDAAVTDAYLAHLATARGGRALDGMTIAVDCANGAATVVGPAALRAAGASFTVIGADPDGTNINACCGATHPEPLAALVRERGADMGLAFDGDADRVIAVDEQGSVVDGDAIMVALALDLHERGELAGDAVVVTVMSNLGLHRALGAAGVSVIETPVGDRHVVAAMRERGAGLGGEQSGHIVFAKHATTGDGILTGLLLADLVRRSGRPLSALAAVMTRFPQHLVNVRVEPGRALADSPHLGFAVAEAERELGAEGRVLVRTSGTEPLVRIMVEAASAATAESVAERLRAVVSAELGRPDGP